MSKAYKKGKKQESEKLIKSVTLEYLNYIAEKEDYPEVNEFVDSICKATAFFCPFFDEIGKAFVFKPRINNKMLDGLGIEPTAIHSYEFEYDDSDELIKEYVFGLTSKNRELLGEDLKIRVTFYYGLVKISNFPVIKKKFAESLMFPLLYPYKYVINSVESDYRIYYPSKKECGVIFLSGEAIELMKRIEFNVIVNTPKKVSCSYKKGVTSTEDKLELAFYEKNFDNEEAKFLSSRKRICCPSQIQTGLFYAKNEMGEFTETAIRTETLSYEINDKIVASVSQYISHLSQIGSIKFESFEFAGEHSVSYETGILSELFNIADSDAKVEDTSVEMSECVIDLLYKNLKLDKHYINKYLDIFEYHEIFDENKLAKLGVKIEYIKSFKYPIFQIIDDNIKIKDSDKARVVEACRIMYKGREFFAFIVKKIRKINAYLNLLSLESCDIHVGYAEISSILIFEVSGKNDEKYIREAFVERNLNAWNQYFKDYVKADIAKSSRINDMLKNSNAGMNGVSLYKADI